MGRGTRTKTMNSKNWQKGKNFSLGTRLSRRGWTLNPSLELIPPQFICSPSMSEGLTPEHMETGKSSMKVVLKFSGPKLWNQHGRTNLLNGKKDPKPDFLNGLEFVLAKKKETLIHQRVRRMVLLKKQQKKKKTMRKRKKKRRRKRSKW